MPYGVIVADPPWAFNDRMRMAKVKRSSADHYATLRDSEIMGLPVCNVAADTALLALWCPSSKLDVGLAVGRAWGFPVLVTLWTWVKRNERRLPIRYGKLLARTMTAADLFTFMQDGAFAYGMGWTFKGFTEHALIMRRGRRMKPACYPRNGRQWPGLPHSAKPEALQNDLDAMFPKVPKLELFARRARSGWTCTGLECDGQDVRAFLDRHWTGARAGCRLGP